MGIANTTTNKTVVWRENLEACVANEAAVLDAMAAHKGFEWHLMGGLAFSPATQSKCVQVLHDACAPDLPGRPNLNTWENRTLSYELPRLAANATVVPNLIAHLASFLLLRSDYAFIGFQWAGCSSSEVPTGDHVLRPQELDVDYGEALGRCTEVSPGVFTRELQNAKVSLDCSIFEGTIAMKKHGPN